MTDKDLQERISDLERRVKELEAQPKEVHTHFHSYPPVYAQPYQPPEPMRFTIGDPPLSPYYYPNAAGPSPTLFAQGGN